MSENQKLTMQHKRSLAKIRQLVNSLIEKLEEILDSDGLIEELPPEWKYIWGEKENAVSALTKLTGLMVKIIPVEREIADGENGGNMKKNLSDADNEIIQRFYERWEGRKNNVNNHTDTVAVPDN